MIYLLLVGHIILNGKKVPYLPVKVRPNTNSVGGTSSFGVVVSVMESFEGSISCSLEVAAASALMLYGLAVPHTVTSLEGEDLKALVGSN